MPRLAVCLTAVVCESEDNLQLPGVVQMATLCVALAVAGDVCGSLWLHPLLVNACAKGRQRHPVLQD